MNRDEMQELNDKLNVTGHTRNSVKAMGNEIADLMGKVELISAMVEDDLLDLEIYEKYVVRQKKEIKDKLAQIYSKLNLDETKGRYDHVFEKDE